MNFEPFFLDWKGFLIHSKFFHLFSSELVSELGFSRKRKLLVGGIFSRNTPCFRSKKIPINPGLVDSSHLAKWRICSWRILFLCRFSNIEISVF